MDSRTPSSDRRELSERERLILQIVVHTYVTTAEAVGSRAIVKRFNLDLSPATVRNVMADLEDMGYLQQLHSSSGRIPTDYGYRYYVDYLMRVQELTQHERQRIEREFQARTHDLDGVMRQTCHLLALVSEQTSIVEAPDEAQAEVRHIELVPIGEKRVALLTVDGYGQVHTSSTEVDNPLAEAELRRLSSFLNANFEGTAVARLASAVEHRVQEYHDEQRRLAETAAELLRGLPMTRHGQVFIDGTSHLFDQPEFRDMAKARAMFTLLEERDRLGEILRARFEREKYPGAKVLIGSEGEDPTLQDISVVAAPYRVRDQDVGILGVLGPRRMQYGRVTALVDYTANLLSNLMTRRAH